MQSPFRILLVEDSPGDAELTREALEEGKLLVNVTVVTDGVQALDFLLRRPPFEQVPVPDLVLLDLNLPKLNGHQVLTEMRTHEALQQIPVVILTTSGAESDIQMAYHEGANCYVAKPVGLAAFREIVRSIETFWFTVVRLPSN